MWHQKPVYLIFKTDKKWIYRLQIWSKSERTVCVLQISSELQNTFKYIVFCYAQLKSKQGSL